MTYPGITNINDINRLNQYVELIENSNKQFNLTGYKTKDEIRDHLLSESLLPFHNINVPRGTLIADMGSGAGIPGIPLSILLENSQIIMFDATLKKIEFINHAINILDIQNARGVCGRIEELGKNPEYREMFNWVTTRAMADPYTAAELGSALIKKEGYMYLYTSEKQGLINEKIIEHFSLLGMKIETETERKIIFNAECNGILLKKVDTTDSKYPRRINAIRRDSARINRQGN